MCGHQLCWRPAETRKQRFVQWATTQLLDMCTSIAPVNVQRTWPIIYNWQRFRSCSSLGHRRIVLISLCKLSFGTFQARTTEGSIHCERRRKALVRHAHLMNLFHEITLPRLAWQNLESYLSYLLVLQVMDMNQAQAPSAQTLPESLHILYEELAFPDIKLSNRRLLNRAKPTARPELEPSVSHLPRTKPCQGVHVWLRKLNESSQS